MTPIFYFSLFLLLIAAIRFMVVLFNYLSRPFLPYGKANPQAFISVLIPARNEANGIGNLLDDLLGQEHRTIEIIVYNDCSTDATGDIVAQMAKQDNRIKLINGIPLPEGWLGKNHACHRLALEAKGQYLLFLDADVRVKPQLIGNAVCFIERKRLLLLSMFPQQVMGSFGEYLVVPNMNWILLTLLPLRLVQWSKKRSLAAANGQLMMFNAQHYREQQWHERFRYSTVEDIIISRAMKRGRFRMATLLGNNDILCRMYQSYTQALDGFAKNVCSFFGGSTLITAIFTLMVTLTPLFVLFVLPFPLAFGYFFSIFLSRIMVSALSKQSVVKNFILWPIQHYVFIRMVIRSILFYRGGHLQWKGRSIN
jgi:glycosyltransferase involved in cell wall biosynthesis